MKTYRIVTDIQVPDGVPEESVKKIAADTAMNFRWALQREAFYAQDWPRVVLNHRGVKLLPETPPPAPVPVTPDFLQTQLGPGPGRD